MEEDELRRREQARRDELEKQADNWARSQRLRSFIDAVAAVKQQESGHSEQMAEWLAWAREHADRIDPLVKGIPSA